MQTLVKICGLKDEQTVRAARDAGADMIGLVFFPPSPRYLSPADAQALLADFKGPPTRVALLVDADDALIDDVAGTGVIDLLQLHGHETPDRVAEIKQRTGLPVMKVLRVATADDVAEASRFKAVADRILFDAKAPKDMKGALPGGNGLRFDWRLLEGLELSIPWMLSGGLDAENVGDAIRLTGATAVDTSSGVEDSPGVKNVDKIRVFVTAARSVPIAA